MRKFIALFSVAALLAVGIGSALGAGDAVYFQPGAKVNKGAAIQDCVPTATLHAKTLGTKGFKNYSTTNLTCVWVQGAYGNAAAPTAVAVRARVGGFSTNAETDYFIIPSTGGKIYFGPGVTKVGFGAISSAQTTNRVGGARK